MYTQLSLPSPWILIKPAGRRLGEEEKEKGGGEGPLASNNGSQLPRPLMYASDTDIS